MGTGLGGKNVIVRMELALDLISFGRIAVLISEESGDVIAMDVISTSKQKSTRDVTIAVSTDEQLQRILERLRGCQGLTVINVSDRTFLMHLGGKIEVRPKLPISIRDDLSRVYTPDVARICQAIYESPQKAFNLTIKKNTVAVVSDGSAVLGLGNLGALPAMPVMEGKAMLFKQFGDVDAFPICLNTQDPEEIIRTVILIAPAFGGINLEDIASPHCFEIERRLQEQLDIPVFHDDQHGTAVVLLAGLMNALKITGKKMNEIRVVINGVGAAGTACAEMLRHAGVTDLIGVDRKGIVQKNSSFKNAMWSKLSSWTNPRNIEGGLSEAVRGADVLIGVSSANVFTREMIMTMNQDAIVFAMANPLPEILPDQIEDIVAVVATGRSDYPNQINNVLCFPGIFRAALDCRASTINEAMKMAAAEAIASVIPERELNSSYIIPSVFNPKVVPAIRDRVVRAAIQSGIARKKKMPDSNELEQESHE